MSFEQAIATLSTEVDNALRRLDKIERTNQHYYIHGGRSKEVQIVGGEITATLPNILLAPETGSTDDLDIINGGADGKIVILANANDGDIITVRTYTISGGNIDLRGSGNNRAMLDRHDSIMLMYRESTLHWEQVAPETLNSLIGVVIDSPNDGDVLTYNGVGGNWENMPSGAGVSDFLGLTDTPNDYTGAAGFAVAVNGTEDGLEFIPFPSAPVDSVNGQTGVVVLDTDDISEGATNKYFHLHAASHQHGGADEIATATPGANAIPKANGSGKLDDGWINDLWLDVAGDTMAGNIDMDSNFIVNLPDPVSAQDAATKAYVDALVQGLDVKASVRAATTANITLSGAQTIDGVSVIAGDRVLVKDQSTGQDNGIYVAAAGAWSRAPDANASAEVTSGMYTFVTEGTVNGDNGWVLTTNDPITLGTTPLVFSQFSAAMSVIDGAGLTKSGNVLSVNVDTTSIEINSDTLRRTALTGDVTAAAGSSATTIANNAVTTAKILDANVTLAKLANIATDSLIGRDTAGSGVPENILLNATLSMDGSGNLQRAALTGDVTASAGSNATTIPNNTVTYAKMQDVSATDKVIGRSTAGAGDPEEITFTAAARALADDATAADMRTTLGLVAGGAGDVWVEKAGDTMTGTLIIAKTSAASTRESIFKGQVSDAGDAAFMFYNQTSADSAMIPAIGGFANAATRQSLTFEAFATAAQDTGTVAMMRFDALRTDSTTDPPNGTLAAITTRPLFTWANNGTVQMSMSAAGEVAIGVDSNITEPLGVASGTAGIGINRYVNSSFGPAVNFRKSRNATVGSNTIVSANDEVGKLQFLGANGTGFDVAAQIIAKVDGTPGASTDMPGRLEFYTTPDASVTPTLALTIDRSQDLTATGSLFIPEAERVRIGSDPSGRTSPDNTTARFLMEMLSAGPHVSLWRASNVSAASDFLITIGRSRGSAAGDNTVVQSGDRLGTIEWWGGDGSGTVATPAASLVVKVDGTPGNGDMPGRFEFSTTVDGGSSPTLALTLDSTQDATFANRAYFASGKRISIGGDPTGTRTFPDLTGLALQVETYVDGPHALFWHNVNNATGPIFAFGKSRSTTLGGNALVSDNDILGTIEWYGADGSSGTAVRCAQIMARVNGTAASQDMPTDLEFYTTPDGGFSPVLGMTLDRDGNLDVVGTGTFGSSVTGTFGLFSTGARSGSKSLVDDEVWEIYTGTGQGLLCVYSTNGGSANNRYAFVAWRSNSTPVCSTISIGSDVVLATTDLTGAGTDTKLNVSCRNGGIQIMNRLGATQSFGFFIMR